MISKYLFQFNVAQKINTGTSSFALQNKVPFWSFSNYFDESITVWPFLCEKSFIPCLGHLLPQACSGKWEVESQNIFPPSGDFLNIINESSLFKNLICKRCGKRFCVKDCRLLSNQKERQLWSHLFHFEINIHFSWDKSVLSISKKMFENLVKFGMNTWYFEAFDVFLVHSSESQEE